MKKLSKMPPTRVKSAPGKNVQPAIAQKKPKMKGLFDQSDTKAETASVVRSSKQTTAKRALAPIQSTSAKASKRSASKPASSGVVPKSGKKSRGKSTNAKPKSDYADMMEAVRIHNRWVKSSMDQDYQDDQD